MININITDNIRQAIGSLDAAFAKQVPFATSLAINKTAQDVKAAEEGDILHLFDKPRPFSRRSVFMRPGNKAKPEARVWLKDDFGTREHYLAPHVFSGVRSVKRFESKLRRVGILPPGLFVVPGAACPLDAFGNISRGVIQQVLSYLSAAEDVAGFTQNTTERTRKGLERRLGRRLFNLPGVSGQLVIYRGTGDSVGRLRLGKDGHNVAFRSKLPQPGIWVRAAFGSGGDAIRPLFIFVKQPTYRHRWDFFGTAKKTIDARFPTHFAAAWQHAVATAR